VRSVSWPRPELSYAAQSQIDDEKLASDRDPPDDAVFFCGGNSKICSPRQEDAVRSVQCQGVRLGSR
jgi:hypothetical protein